ncbi:hypothetical protein HKX48_005965 [Thoreauomyces humboldtii]|nr:hypothetical protein HKX48_005965 [Thoreauomyces humboldtii]
MPASLVQTLSGGPLLAHGLPDESGEEALRRLREFLSAIATNAAAGDLQSASLSLSCLGEPPVPENDAFSPVASKSLAPALSPINLMVLKLRAARIQREQKRAIQQHAGQVPFSSSSEAASMVEQLIPEVHQVTPKRPRSLHQEAVLRLFDQSRLRRWWEWHDRQIELLKEDKLQKQRRRQFLANLRTHAWINAEKEPVEDIKRRKHRAQSLSKIRTDLLPSSDSTAAYPVSPPSEEQVAHALTQRRQSISKLRPRSPVTPTFEYPVAGDATKRASRTLDEHRRFLLGEHTGTLEVQKVDFWAQWSAQELLTEQRETLREHLDAVLTHSAANVHPDLPQPCRNLKHVHAQRFFLDEERAW